MESKVSDIIDDEADDSIAVIDVDADSDEDLEDSYIGKIIIECDVCHSKLYKDASEVIPSEDDEKVVNIEEECPFCYSTDGYHIVGQVAPYQPEEPSVEVEPRDEEDDVEEGLGDAVVSGVGGSAIGSGVGMALGGLPGAAVGKLAGGIAGAIHGAKMESLPKRKFTHIKKVCDNLSESQCSQCDRVADILQNSTYRKNGTYPRGFKFLSSNGTVGEVQYNGVKYAFRKRDDGTYKVMTSADAGWNWSETLYKESIEDITESGNKRTLKHLKRAEEGCYKEDFSKVEIETDKDEIKVTSEPIEDEPEQEVLAPIAPEKEAAIDANSESFDDDKVVDDVDIDEIEEESLNSCATKYFKEQYKGAKSFKTSKIVEKNNQFIVEGILTCMSGRKHNVNMQFNPVSHNLEGKCKFEGNVNCIKESRAVKLNTNLKGSKLVVESLTCK